MKNYSREARIAKGELLKYCTKICSGLGRVSTKLVVCIMLGVAKANNCRLTEIGRALEENITIKKTVERLSRGLQRFNDHTALRDNYLRVVRPYIDDNTIYPIDNSDLAKEYSVAMEALHEVYDGSTGKIVPGYMTLEITALTHKTTTPLPVYERVYSAAEKDYVSENDEILRGLRFLSDQYGHGGIRVLDRGYDADVYIRYFTKNRERFIVRIKKNRNVIHNGKTLNIEDLVKRYKGKYTMNCTIHREKVNCKITEIPVQLPAFDQKHYNLVVLYGLGKTPMMLLTNCQGSDKRFCNAVIKMYLLRWRIEDHFRFKKYQYNFEDFRVRKLHAIRTLHQFVTILTGLMAILAQSPHSAITRLLRITARAVPRAKNQTQKKLLHYELAAGFATLLRKTSLNLSAFFPPLRWRPSCRQLSFFSKLDKLLA